MSKRKNISEELSALSPAVAAIPVVNVFTVPEGYFNALPANVLSAIYAENDIFSGAEKQSFSVPDGYFDGLADAILNKIKTQVADTASAEIMQLSPAIAAIGNKNIFTVPAGYFQDTVKQAICNILPPAKVVQMQSRFSVFKYAAAAVVTGIIGLSVLSIFNNRTSNNRLMPQQSKAVMAKANQILNNNSFDQELNKISDKDIQQYLEQRGQDVNAALVASATDENNLPNPTDYLTDDKTLDDFLHKSNLNN